METTGVKIGAAPARKEGIIMGTPLDEIVVADSNREAFERIIASTQARETPLHLFVSGPVGSGKSTLLRARADEKDLLSTKKASFHHGAELIAAVRYYGKDEFFEELGTVPVLLLDGFTDLYSDMEVGPMICRLMLAERARLGLDTVIVSEKPMAELDLACFEGALDDFEEMAVTPLTGDERKLFVLKVQEKCQADKEAAPSLDDEAVAFLAAEFSDDLGDVRHAVTFLISAAGIEDGTVIGLPLVKEALGV